MEDFVSKATKAAIRHAKYRKSPKVDTDDILAGILQVISRFDIVKIGTLTIDLKDFDGIASDGVSHETGKISTQKVAYSSSANAFFEKAAQIARKDNSPKVRLVHLLATFSQWIDGLDKRKIRLF
jgi:ATP-dependent Clp protease ATP-binding subunit ClpA